MCSAWGTVHALSKSSLYNGNIVKGMRRIEFDYSDRKWSIQIRFSPASEKEQIKLNFKIVLL